MKVVIPLAGKGTRLRPHTHTVPKPLLEVAGKAVLDYVVEDLIQRLDVEELIFITGHLKEQVEAHVEAHYSVRSHFVEQAVQDGTAGAIKLAQPYVDGPLLIVFVDTLFDADLSVIARDPAADGFIWAKEVEDYQRFGVIVADDEGVMQRIVEKPSEPISTWWTVVRASKCWRSKAGTIAASRRPCWPRTSTCWRAAAPCGRRPPVIHGSWTLCG